MFRGFSKISVDSKGRVAVPSRYRIMFKAQAEDSIVVAPNPLDRSLWLYPLPQWELIEAKLAALSDFDKQSRRTKQMMRGYACDAQLDAQGRVLLAKELREYAGIKRQIVAFGQGNKLELWNDEIWYQQREEWLAQVGDDGPGPPEALQQIAL